MFHMQQNDSPAPPAVARSSSSTAEERFGAAVQAARTKQGMSQRKFAEMLTERGMPVDASAVSRIESGARSVRLVEAMAIAEVLDTNLESLTRDSRTPSQRLRALRQQEEFAMHGLENPLVELGLAMTEVRAFLREHPDLVKDVVSDDGTVLDHADNYFEWSAAAASSDWMAWTRAFVVESEADKDCFVRMVAAMARCYPILDTEIDDRDEEEH